MLHLRHPLHERSERLERENVETELHTFAQAATYIHTHCILYSFNVNSMQQIYQCSEMSANTHVVLLKMHANARCPVTVHASCTPDICTLRTLCHAMPR
jgi:hypothetical protein